MPAGRGCVAGGAPGWGIPGAARLLRWGNAVRGSGGPRRAALFKQRLSVPSVRRELGGEVPSSARCSHEGGGAAAVSSHRSVRWERGAGTQLSPPPSPLPGPPPPPPRAAVMPLCVPSLRSFPTLPAPLGAGQAYVFIWSYSLTRGNKSCLSDGIRGCRFDTAAIAAPS